MDQIKSPINFDRFEILKVGLGSFPSLNIVPGGSGKWATGEASNIVAHNLGFTPTLIPFQQQGSFNTYNYIIPMISIVGFLDIGLWFDLQISVDSTYVYMTTKLTAWGTSSSQVNGQGFNSQYYLVQERVKRVD